MFYNTLIFIFFCVNFPVKILVEEVTSKPEIGGISRIRMQRMQKTRPGIEGNTQVNNQQTRKRITIS